MQYGVCSIIATPTLGRANPDEVPFWLGRSDMNVHDGWRTQESMAGRHPCHGPILASVFSSTGIFGHLIKVSCPKDEISAPR